MGGSKNRGGNWEMVDSNIEGWIPSNDISLEGSPVSGSTPNRATIEVHWHSRAF